MRWAGAFLLLLSLVVSPLSALAVDVEYCDSRARKEHQDYLSVLKRKLGDQRLAGTGVKRLLSLREKEVVAHEKAHFKGGGKWSKRIVYFHYARGGRKWKISGCVEYKEDTPPDVAIKAALAPDVPSRFDIQLAREMETKLRQEKKPVAACKKRKYRQYLRCP